MKKRLYYCVMFDKVFIYKNLLIRYTLINVKHQVRAGIKNSVICCAQSASAIAIRSSINVLDFMILRASKYNLFHVIYYKSPVCFIGK